MHVLLLGPQLLQGQDPESQARGLLVGGPSALPKLCLNPSLVPCAVREDRAL